MHSPGVNYQPRHVHHQPRHLHQYHISPGTSICKLHIMASSAAHKLQEVQRLYRQQAEAKPGVPGMSPQQVWQQVQQKDQSIVLVDTRDTAEQEVSVLLGPTLTKAEFEGSKDRFRGHTVVCYCTVGVRSGQYAAELRNQGFQALNLEGSVLGWTHAGYPLVELHNREQSTKRVHVYGKRWALQADGYEAVTYPLPLVKAGVGLLWSWLKAPRKWWAAAQAKEKESEIAE